jgi:leucyl-tRNA synthetase
MSENVLELIKDNQLNTRDAKIDVFTNRAIDKINFAFEKFRYNVIIAVFHDIYNFYVKVLESKKNYKNLKENFEKILIIMMPVIPHLTNECLIKITDKSHLSWPKVDKSLLDSDEKEIVIQINGKKRSNIIINKKDNENDIIEKIKKMSLIEKYIKNKKIDKTIYVKERLINIIVK